MSSLDEALYHAPRRSKASQRTLWRVLYRKLQQDGRLAAYRPAERRAVRAVFIALHEVRDFLTGLIDADLPRVAKAADYGVTVTREALQKLWELGYLEVIPRRRWDPEARPPGWKGTGKWLQHTNAYELRDPDKPPRWPIFQPLQNGTELDSNDTSDEVEWTAERLKPFEKPDSGSEIRAPSHLTDLFLSFLRSVEPVEKSGGVADGGGTS